MKTHKTIKQILEGKLIHEPENYLTKRTLLGMLEMGYTEDYIPSYNVLTHGHNVYKIFTEEQIEDPQIDMFAGDGKTKDHHDFIWLCNQVARLAQKHKNKYWFNGYRICRAGVWTERYQCIREWSVGGRDVKFVDNTIINKVTNRAYVLGWTEPDYD